jgi:hypothetical protein
MPKIVRQTFVQFGVNVNASADICQFGSPATGSPVYTSVIATLQALAAWTTGWAAETVANNRPFLEDMNAIHYVFSYFIAYILEMGIPEWDAGTIYYTNSIVQYGGVLYQSLIDTNINVTPVVGVSWKLVVQPPFSTQNVVTGSRALGSSNVYRNTTGKTMYVSMSQSGNSSGSFNAYSDAATTPITSIASGQIFNNNGGSANISFMVLPNNYYYVSSASNGGGTITSWTEWY